MPGDKYSFRRLILILCVCGIVAFLGIRIFDGIMILNKVSENHLLHEYSTSLEDYNLVGKKYKDKLKAVEIYQSNNKSPIALNIFDNKYYLVSYKINLTENTLLSNVLHTTTRSAAPAMMEPYTTIREDLSFKLKYREVPATSVRQIYLTISGDSLQDIVKYDSIVSYFFLCNNFSIKYFENEPIDLFVTGRENAFGNTTALPMDLLFLKRDSVVYLMMMTPSNSGSTIHPNLLYNIVMGRE